MEAAFLNINGASIFCEDMEAYDHESIFEHFLIS